MLILDQYYLVFGFIALCAIVGVILIFYPINNEDSQFDNINKGKLSYSATISFFRINRFLARILGGLNAILAVVIILAGMGWGLQFSDSEPKGLFFGFLAGTIIATLVCGTIAIFISIRQEVEDLNKKLKIILDRKE